MKQFETSSSTILFNNGKKFGAIRIGFKKSMENLFQKSTRGEFCSSQNILDFCAQKNKYNDIKKLPVLIKSTGILRRKSQ